MKGNAEKSHLTMSTNESVDFQPGGSLTEGSDCEKMLEVKTDYKLNFDKLLKNLCSEANNKLRPLEKATPHMSVEKKKKVMNSFFSIQVNYCPLMWMLHSRRKNYIVRNLHEQYLRLIYIKNNVMKNYLLKIAQPVYSTQIYRFWQLNCTKLKMDFRQKFLLKILLQKKTMQ